MEQLQGVKVKDGDQPSSLSFKALFAMRQTKDKPVKRCKDCKWHNNDFGKCQYRLVRADEFLGTMIGTKYVSPEVCGSYDKKTKWYIKFMFWRQK